MSVIKKVKDNLIKILIGQNVVPRGLFEMDEYFRHNGAINFRREKGDDSIIAISTDFRYGSIITAGKTEEELDKNIKDAILTSFEVPSSYAKEAAIRKVGDRNEKYALV